MYSAPISIAESLAVAWIEMTFDEVSGRTGAKRGIECLALRDGSRPGPGPRPEP